MMTQALELKNRPHVVVATPGRLVDHMNSESGEWDLSRIKFLVRIFWPHRCFDFAFLRITDRFLMKLTVS